MSESPSNQSGPLVVCITCGVNDQRQWIAEIDRLAASLDGLTLVEAVSGKTTAMRVSLPEAARSRFVTALVFNGATLLAADNERHAGDLIVLVTAERQ